MSSLLLPFALKKGRMVRPGEVDPGLSCGCVCPACKNPLVARKGVKRQPHFAHYVSGECTSGFETAVHRMAKQLICDRLELSIPKWDGGPDRDNPPMRIDSAGGRHFGAHVYFAERKVRLLWALEEKCIGAFRADVAAADDTGDLLIEVRVTHQVQQEKAVTLGAQGFRVLEINLSNVGADVAMDAAEFERIVLWEPGNRSWIAFPEAELAWQASKSDLDQRVSRLEAEHDAGSLALESRAVFAASTPVRIPHPSYGTLLLAEPGHRVWHRTLGVGTVIARLPVASPVYRIQFPDHGTRTIVLQSHREGEDWRFVD